jgi:ADP-heptose:LPS heptosyltransferase
MRLKTVTKPIERSIKRLLLRGLLFRSRDRKADKSPQFGAGSNLLFIRLNKIGDALVSTPLLKVLKQGLGCTITVVADRRNSFIFEHCPFVDRVIVFRKGLGGMLAVRELTRTESFDAVCDLHDDVSATATFLVAMAESPFKFGLLRETENVYTHTVTRPDPVTTHIVDRIMSLASLFGVTVDPLSVNISYQPTDESMHNARRFLDEFLPDRSFLVGINISAGSAARFWGAERFRKLMAFFEAQQVSIVILSPRHDLELANRIADNRHPVYCTTDFNQFSAMISQLDFLFTPDTSVVHLGSAFEIPQFGIYVKYKTTDMIWSPYRGKFDCVVTEEGSFENLEFEQVIARLRPFWDSIKSAI